VRKEVAMKPASRLALRPKVLLAVALMTHVPAALAAQERPESTIPLGEQVRIWAPGYQETPLEAEVFVWRADTLVLRTAEPMLYSFAVGSIDRLELKKHKSNAGKGALIGAGVGAVLGAAAGLIAASADDGGGFIDFGPGAYTAGGAVAGVLLGGVVGLVIGIVTGSDRWEEVEVPQFEPVASLRLMRGGRPAFGFGLRLRL